MANGGARIDAERRGHADRAVPPAGPGGRRLRPGPVDRPLGGGGARRDARGHGAAARAAWWCGSCCRPAAAALPASVPKKTRKSAYVELTDAALQRGRARCLLVGIDRLGPGSSYALALVAVAVAVLAITEIGPPTSSARTSREIVTAEQGVVQSTVTGSGNIAAGTDVTVNFNTSGTLQDVYVHVGQHVNGRTAARRPRSDLGAAVAQPGQGEPDRGQDNLNCVEGETSDCGSGGSGSGRAPRGPGAPAAGRAASSSTTSYSGAGRARSSTRPSIPAPRRRRRSRARPRRDRPSRPVVHRSVGDQDHAERDRDRGRPEHDAGVRAPARAAEARRRRPRPRHDDHLDSLAGQHRLGPGVRLLGAGRRAQRRGRASTSTKLYAPVSGTIASLSSLTPGDSVSGGGSRARPSGGSELLGVERRPAPGRARRPAASADRAPRARVRLGIRLGVRRDHQHQHADHDRRVQRVGHQQGPRRAAGDGDARRAGRASSSPRT